MMASMSQTIERLCMALNLAGRDIAVEKKVFYSIKYQKLVTVWKIKEGRETLLKTYKAAEAVKFLAVVWKELKEDGADNPEN